MFDRIVQREKVYAKKRDLSLQVDVRSLSLSQFREKLHFDRRNLYALGIQIKKLGKEYSWFFAEGKYATRERESPRVKKILLKKQ